MALWHERPREKRKRWIVAAVHATLFGLLAVLGLGGAVALAAPTFVQVKYADPQTPVQSLAVTFAAAQTAGNLNLVAVAWNDATTSVVSVTDTRGHVYRLAAGPTVLPGVATQAMYYAENIVASAANANTVTVTFSAPAPYVDVRVAEYGGIVATSALDGAAGSAGNGTLTTSGAVTTTNASDVLIAANYVGHSTSGPGADYTRRVITSPDQSILEDRVVTATGTYTATAPQSPAGWYIMQVVAFRAAAGGVTPTVSLTASPATVSSGGSALLTWSTTNATSCTASGGWTGAKAIGGSASTGALTATTSYSLTCTGAGGSLSRSATVTMTSVALPVPTVTLSASPASVPSGASSTLTWATTNATSCTASGGWTGVKPISGSISTGALTATTSYSLTCTGAGGSVSRSATVTLLPAPTVTLSASPTSVASGGSSTLTWATTNATSCTASGGWTGAKVISGSASTGALTATTSYNLMCTGAGGSLSRSAMVAVTSVLPAPTVTLSASPTSVASGGSSTLTWSTTNATSCMASAGWTGAKATSGATSTGVLTATTSYNLTCTGTGGSAAKTATAAVTGSVASRFPLHVEAGKRYLVDVHGQPFLMQGDTAWSLIAQLTREQTDQYLEDRRLKGFNTVLVELIEHEYSANPPNDVYGDAPFLVAGDFSTPNDTYFDHAEYVIAKAREKGMLVLLTPAYVGFGGGSQGWYKEMEANGPAKMRGYGQYIANRFLSYDNVLWVEGGDYNVASLTGVRALVDGIRDIDATKLQTYHGSRGTAALEFLGPSESWLNVNNIYAAKDTVIAEAQGEYNRSTMPFFLIEGGYEDESASPAETRQQAWQTVLSGGTGQLMGQKSIWKFDPIWPTRLNTEGARTLVHLRTLLESYAWWTLQPDFANLFLTAGAGTGGARAPAAVAAGGGFAFIYVRDVRDITVDIGSLTGTQVQARWYDPTNGSFTAVAGSPFTRSGSRVFRPTGNNSLGKTDWVLVLDSVP